MVGSGWTWKDLAGPGFFCFVDPSYEAPPSRLAPFGPRKTPHPSPVSASAAMCWANARKRADRSESSTSGESEARGLVVV